VSDESMICPKCAGEMARGFLVDRGDSMVPLQSDWAEGDPRSSRWVTFTGAVDRGKERLPVVSYRCGTCGYLESYARPLA
jgi:hypothetical protein